MIAYTEDANLKLWVPMMEGTGTSLNDISSSAITGTITTPDWEKNSLNGKYHISCNGSTGYADFGDNELVSSTATFVVWVNGTFGQFNAIIAKWATGANYLLSGGWSSDNKLTFYVNTTAGFTRIDSDSALNDGAWHFIVCTFDNSLGSANTKIYIDTTLQAATGNNTGTFSNIAERIGIGAQLTSAGSPAAGGQWVGKIDNVMIFDRILSIEEINDIYRKTYRE